MTIKQTSDQQLKDDVTELKVTMNEVVKPALIDIKNTLATQSYVPVAQYVKDMQDLRARLVILEAFMESAKPVVKAYGVLSNRVLQIIIVGVLAFILYALFKQIPSWIGVS